MSETLILAFQSQLSIVMETVMKTAVYEVNRLVEEGFLEEVRRRKQEVELLKLRLEWAERKLKGVSQRAKCADCGKTGLPNEEPEDITAAVPLSDLEVCGLKQEEEESESRWGSCEQEPESPEETIKAWQTASPLEESLTREEELKEEDDVARSSCAGHHRDTPEPQNPLQDREEEWSPAVKQDPQPSPSPPQSDALTLGAAAETLGLPSAELLQAAEHTRFSQALRFADSTQNVGRTRRGSGAACEWRNSAGGSPPWTDPSGLADPGSGDEREDELLVRDQLFTSVSPRLSCPELTALSIKQEVIVEEEDGEEDGKGAFSQLNHVTQKTPGGGGMRRLGPHSKSAAGLALPHSTQQPIRTHPRFSSPKINAASTNPAPQMATPQHRNPQASLPPQRHLQGDKRPGAVSLTRNNQWVSIKTQHPLHQHLIQGGPQPHHPHPSKVPLRCGQCGRNFPHPSNLRAHLQTHSGERPFSCSLCGRSFTKLSNLKAHRRVHTGERPYCCQACGKRFTQKCNLKRHQRIHLEHGL
ncbi:zinc finger protein 324B isoform X2 [Hypomesus transpacificus]|nr:zinc finger protein 324B isoform X2 [Hypomesus transpacificus]XP_046900836.1 zinc finger protein 324B isoform X2 [Hypomesus transpacificus]